MVNIYTLVQDVLLLIVVHACTSYVMPLFYISVSVLLVSTLLILLLLS